MSVASRITSMTEHIQNAYDSIERFGVDTENIDKNLVNLSNTITNEIYDKLPKASGNGSNFTLENVQNGKLDLFEMEGNTHQDSYTGKNKFNNVYGQTRNVYTTHINANNPLGSVDCYPINLLPNTQYTLKVDMNGYQKTNAWIAGMCFANGDTISLLQSGSIEDITTTTFTTDSTGVVYVGHRYGFTYGETGRMDLFLQTAKIQLEQGSTATSYEPYVGGTPSPNPDYPQPIEVVTGDNTINVTGKNLFDITQYPFTANKSYGNNGEWTSWAGYCAIANYFPVKGNTTYTFSNNLGKAMYYGLVEYDENKTKINYTSSSTNTFTTLANTRYIRFAMQSTIPSWVQIEQGSTATTYEKYQSQTYSLNLGSIELCKIGDYKDYIYKENNKWYKYGAIRKYTTGVSAVILSNGTYRIKLKDISNLHDITNSTNIYVPSLSKNAIIRNQTGYSASRYNQGWGGLAMTYSVNVSSQIGEFETTQQLLNWFNNNEKVYIVINPVYDYIDITEITNSTLINQLEAIETETGTNIFEVSNDNDVLPSLNVKRLKELEKLS